MTELKDSHGSIILALFDRCTGRVDTPQPMGLRNDSGSDVLKTIRYRTVLLILYSALLLVNCVDDDPVQPKGIRLAWERIEYPSYNEVVCTTVDPDGRIFLGMHHSEGENTVSRIYISADNGESWIDRDLGDFEIQFLATDSEGRLFATKHYCDILRSLDHGESWETLDCDTLSSCLNVIVIDGHDNLYLPRYHRGIYLSVDHGDSWAQICDGPEGYCYSLAVNSEDVLFAATDAGLYRSRDGGENWQELPDAPGAESYFQMMLDSTDRIFINTRDNLYVSNDDGETWTTLQPPGRVYYLFLEGRDRLFAFCPDSLYLSDDGGERWVPTLGYSGTPYFNKVAVNAAGDIFVTGRWGVCRSIDDGASWDILGFMYSRPVDIAIGKNGYFYALIRFGGVYRADGAFESWTVFNTGLPCVESYCLVNGPHSTLLTGTADGVYISREESPGWSCAGLEGKRIVALFALNGDSVAASTEDNGLFVSADSGTEWRHVGMTGYNTSCLIETADDRLLAGANFGGMFRYTGDGILWDQMNAGLADLRVTALAVISSGDILAGTRGGLFVSPDGGSSWRRFNEERIDVSTICITGEDILIGTPKNGILWTMTGRTELYPQNDGMQGYIHTITTDHDRFVYVLTSLEIYRSTLSLEDAPPARP